MPGNATFGKEVGASDKKFVENHFKFVKTGQVNLLCRFQLKPVVYIFTVLILGKFANRLRITFVLLAFDL